MEMWPLKIILGCFLFAQEWVYCTRMKSGVRAWVAPYQIAGPRMGDEPKPEARQTSEWEFPNIFLWGALQFSDPVVGSLVVVPYSAAAPAWFNTGFISFGLVLKVSLLIGIFPIIAAILADLATPAGVYGFLHPDRVFPLCGILWASFIIPNMVYVTCLVQESVLTTGAGYYWLLLLLATVLFFLAFLGAQRTSRRWTQNTITAVTNAYGAVASFSYLWTFFSGGKKSPFDIISFTSYPSQFKWTDPSDVTLFLFFLLLIVIGMTLDYRRDLVQQSPGFGGGKDEPIAPRTVGEGPGIDLPQGPPKGPQRLTSTESTEPFLVFPKGQEPPSGIRRTEYRVESESDVDSDSDSIEQDDDFALKWLDPEMVAGVTSRATTAEEAELLSPFISPAIQEEVLTHHWYREAARG